MRLAIAALTVLALAAPAAAQTLPPDERAAAQAFADAAGRFDAKVAAIGEVEPRWPKRCPRALGRVPKSRRAAGTAMAMAHGLRAAVAPMKQPLREFRAELAEVATQEPALIAGRAAVRRLGRAWEATRPPGDFCAELGAWRRAGYPRAAGRAAEKQVERFFAALRPATLRKLDAAAVRMQELGVSRQDAQRFGGTSGSW